MQLRKIYFLEFMKFLHELETKNLFRYAGRVWGFTPLFFIFNYNVLLFLMKNYIEVIFPIELGCVPLKRKEVLIMISNIIIVIISVLLRGHLKFKMHFDLELSI